jgi:predicted permease
LLRRKLPDPPPLPVAAATDLLSLRALLLMAGLGLLTGLLASVAPAFRAWGVDPLDALKGDRLVIGFGRFTARHLLAALQVAASVALLFAGALLVRSSWNAAHVDVAFEPRQLLVASLNLARGGYDVPRALAFQERLRDELRALPGVESAALGLQLPTRAAGTSTVESEGRSRSVGFNFVSPGYLETLRLRLLKGRDIDATDIAGGPPVALVNEELAQAFWPGADPIGKRIGAFGPRQASLEVVGVVRYRAGGIGDVGQPMFLGPRSQLYGTFPWQPRTAIYVRARAGDPRRLAPALARVVESLDPDLPLLGVRTAEDELGLPFAQQRLLLTTLSALSGIALFLTFAGVFGVVASATDARRREIGVRVALGARPSQVMTLVLGQGARLVAAGLVLGTPLVLGAGPLLSGFLLGVKPYDAGALVAAAAVLTLASLLAAYGPARRALAQDPTLALRAE